MKATAGGESGDTPSDDYEMRHKERHLKFAKIVFFFAGIWGIVQILPMYVIFEYIGEKAPPAINHPEFYYGFAGVTLAWQFVFLLIGSDPIRYRMMMLPSILEKVSYVLAIVVLLVQHRLSASTALPAASDFVLGVLFTGSWMKTTLRAESSKLQ